MAGAAQHGLDALGQEVPRERLTDEWLGHAVRPFRVSLVRLREAMGI
jgi:hypothetical protein